MPIIIAGIKVARILVRQEVTCIEMLVSSATLPLCRVKPCSNALEQSTNSQDPFSIIKMRAQPCSTVRPCQGGDFVMRHTTLSHVSGRATGLQLPS